MSQPRKLSARRRLILCIIVLTALFTLSYINDRSIVAQVDNGNAVVGVAKTPTTSPTDAQVEAAVREAIAQAGGLPANVGPGKKIVIQPNLVEAGWPSSDVNPSVPYAKGVVTDVRVVRAIVDMCLEAGASVDDIVICEGSAGFRAGTTHSGYSSREATEKAYYDAGFDRNKDMRDDVTNVQLIDANHVRDDKDDVYPSYPFEQDDGYNPDHVTKVQLPGGTLISRNYFIPNCVATCDVLIRVPVLKTHDLAGYTGGLKLGFGIAPSDIYHIGYGTQNKTMKWNLLHQEAWGYDQLQTNTRGMVDMALARPPDMVVIDGLVGVTTGPTRVSPGGSVPGTASPYMSCIIASQDTVAGDTVAALAIGYKVNSIPGIGLAADSGLGQDHPGLIDIRGAALGDFRQWWDDQPGSDPATGIPGSSRPPIIYDLNVPDGAHAGGTLFVKPNSFSIANNICKSELYVDGNLVNTVLEASGITWNVSSDTAEGAHQVTYTMYDMMLNKASITRTVNIHRGNSISSILGQSDGTVVFVGPVYITGAATAVDNLTCFVSTENGISGLRLVRSAGVPSSWPQGSELKLVGTLGTLNGQRILNVSYSSNGSEKPTAAPRAFQNSALGGAQLGDGSGVYMGTGPYNLGCLVKTAGKVIAGGSNYFYIDDGSLKNDPAGAGKLKVYSGSIAQPTPGRYVCLTGWSCTENDGGVIRRMLVLRSSSDIVSYN